MPKGGRSVESKVLVTAAITGAIHTPTMSRYLPVTPKEIIREAVSASRAGAAEVHIHARDPKTGYPSSDPSLFAEIVRGIRNESDVLICLTTGGGQDMTVEERLSVVPRFRPELASLNMGSMNFGMFPLAGKYKEWKFDWEQPFLERTKDFIFRNTFADIERALGIMRESGTKPELEIYDVGHVYTVLYLKSQGLLQEPLYLQFVTGILGGIGASIENLMFLKGTADRLLGEGSYRWSAIGAGRMQFPICTAAVLLGGSCRVGLEDNLNMEKGVLAQSNTDQVKKMIRILNELSLQHATPEEGRGMLGIVPASGLIPSEGRPSA